MKEKLEQIKNSLNKPFMTDNLVHVLLDLAGITTRELLNATSMAIDMKKKDILGKPCPDYVDETVSMKVVRMIQVYVNVVNRFVWRADK